MLLCSSLLIPYGYRQTASALERLTKELDRIGAERPRNRHELGHIYPPLERLDTLNPVRWLPKLLRKLSLRKTTSLASLAERSDYGPLAGGIFHDTPGT
jgi:hypothetical protein